MGEVLYIGFKGKHNASSILVQSLASNYCLLTNSFAGLKKDIDCIEGDFDSIIMFGVDKNLEHSFRVERVAEKDDIRYSSVLDLEKILVRFNDAGINSFIAETPTSYLCNEAYWHVLKKFSGKAVFIHIPTIKYFDDSLVQKVKRVFSGGF